MIHRSLAHLFSVPYQDNSWDCGVFVCLYSYGFFLLGDKPFTLADVKDKFKAKITQSPEFRYDMKDIGKFRENLGILIRNLSESYKEKKRDEEERKAERKRLKIWSVYAKPSEEEVKACRAIGLMTAVVDGDTDQVKALLYAKENATVRNRKGQLPLHTAAWTGNVEMVSLLLEAYPEGAQVPDEEGVLPLHYAVMEGRKEVTYAAENGHPEIVRLFLFFAGDVEVEIYSEINAEIVSLLLEAYPEGAQVMNEHGILPMHVAALNGQSEIFCLLLEVYHTVDDDNAEFVSLLLKANESGKFPLHDAADEGHTEIVRFILDAYADGAKVLNENGNLPLHVAAMKGNVEIVSLLLEAYPEGAEVATEKGNLALHHAASKGNVEIVSLLLKAYPEGAQVDKYGILPMHYAALNGHSEVLRLLLNAHDDEVKVDRWCLMRSPSAIFPHRAAQSTTIQA